MSTNNMCLVFAVLIFIGCILSFKVSSVCRLKSCDRLLVCYGACATCTSSTFLRKWSRRQRAAGQGRQGTISCQLHFPLMHGWRDGTWSCITPFLLRALREKVLGRAALMPGSNPPEDNRRAGLKMSGRAWAFSINGRRYGASHPCWHNALRCSRKGSLSRMASIMPISESVAWKRARSDPLKDSFSSQHRGGAC